MSLQFSTTYRNALLDQLATTLGGSEVVKFFTGSLPANCAAADSGTKVAEFDLAASSDWAAASGGTKALASLPLSVTGAAAGVAGYFRFYDAGAVCHMQGTLTLTGGGGDMTLDNTNIQSGQTVKITGFTLTAPGA
jgi:hypothetical protein